MPWDSQLICSGGVALTPGRFQAALVLPGSGTESAPHNSNAGQAETPQGGTSRRDAALAWP